MITVVITDWCVPFDQVVRSIRKFKDEGAALRFINAESRKWWEAHDGDRCCVEYPKTQPYEIITELGYNTAHYELWGGEQGFHAMLDHSTYARLNDAHYAKVEPLPGYLQVAKISGHWPT